MITITCEPNAGRGRRDFIIIKAGEKEKTIYIEQSPASVKRFHLQSSMGDLGLLGFAFGFSKNRLGGYLQVKFEPRIDRTDVDYIYFLAISGGCLFRIINNWLWLYTSAGYCTFKDYAYNYVDYEQVGGLDVEAGVKFVLFKHLTLSYGGSVLLFNERFASAQLGIGWIFKEII